jgi:hypothetical protein
VRASNVDGYDRRGPLRGDPDGISAGTKIGSSDLDEEAP